MGVHLTFHTIPNIWWSFVLLQLSVCTHVIWSQVIVTVVEIWKKHWENLKETGQDKNIEAGCFAKKVSATQTRSQLSLYQKVHFKKRPCPLANSRKSEVSLKPTHYQFVPAFTELPQRSLLCPNTAKYKNLQFSGSHKMTPPEKEQ